MHEEATRKHWDGEHPFIGTADTMAESTILDHGSYS